MKRGTLFSKLSREITLAAKSGGGDPAMNIRLRTAIQTAKGQNMPNDNIERAIKKGTGELESQAFEELNYEGYAPGGVAVLIEAVTDNRNRSAAELRAIFSKYHGNLATSGSVGYLFHRKGQIIVPISALEALGLTDPAAREERLLELVVEADAEEYQLDGDHYTITTAPERLYAAGEILREQGVIAESLKLTYIPENTVAITDETVAGQVLRLCEALDDYDDVQNVHANFDLSEELLARLSA